MSAKYISQDGLIHLSSALAQVGCTTDQMTEALRNISDLIAQMTWASDEITAIKDSLSDMRYDMECQDARLQCQIDVLDMELDELRPATDAKTENPKQKSDLEISNRIIPSEEFLILGDIGWSDDIVDMHKTNMFLD